MFSVITIALILGYMLELAKTRIDAYITRQEEDTDAVTEEARTKSATTRYARGDLGAPLLGEDRAQWEPLVLIKMKFSHSELQTFYDFFRLGVSYEVGKAFEAFVLGNTAAICGATVSKKLSDCWVFWTLVISFTTFMAVLFGYLMLQWENNPVANPGIKPESACNGLPQHMHGNLCVCVNCVPSAYVAEQG